MHALYYLQDDWSSTAMIDPQLIDPAHYVILHNVIESQAKKKKKK